MKKDSKKDERLQLELVNADKDCDHDIQPVLSGGVKCVKCSGWFCF